MNITLVPQRRERPRVAEKSGDVLILNGEAFDFAPLQEGDVLPSDAIASDLFAGSVSRLDGALHLVLVLPFGATAFEDARFPLPLEGVAYGVVLLPEFEDAESAVGGRSHHQRRLENGIRYSQQVSIGVGASTKLKPDRQFSCFSWNRQRYCAEVKAIRDAREP
ncbi:MAG: hypothetical protein P8N68_11355 [Paracoccaceae bacterium]|jgi:hypothetical protein|nr:hypothetical protein [Paracoccaceae bacterium]